MKLDFHDIEYGKVDPISIGYTEHKSGMLTLWLEMGSDFHNRFFVTNDNDDSGNSVWDGDYK